MEKSISPKKKRNILSNENSKQSVDDDQIRLKKHGRINKISPKKYEALGKNMPIQK